MGEEGLERRGGSSSGSVPTGRQRLRQWRYAGACHWHAGPSWCPALPWLIGVSQKWNQELPGAAGKGQLCLGVGASGWRPGWLPCPCWQAATFTS